MEKNRILPVAYASVEELSELRERLEYSTKVCLTIPMIVEK